MPILYPGESALFNLPHSYSPATVSRRFEIIDEIVVAGTVLYILYDRKTPLCAVINAELTQIEGEARHPVVATLELRSYPQRLDILSVHNYWQDNEALQAEGTVVEKRLRDQGLATALYESLVLQKGLTLMSDNHHYAGGKALWQKIARSSKQLAIFVLDTQDGLFYPYDGYRVRYDDQTIPEEQIWSIHPDERHYGIVLVAEDRRKYFSGDNGFMKLQAQGDSGCQPPPKAAIN